VRRAAQVAHQRDIVPDLLGVVYVLKCLIDPDIPVNDGFYRLIDIRSRPGTVVHARHPAAVAAGWEIAMQLCDLLFKALAPALPDRVVAGTKGCVCNIAFGALNPASGEYFTYYETIAGGYGATLTTDGMDAVQAHFQNTENAPVEETEANYPVRILRYAAHRKLGGRRAPSAAASACGETTPFPATSRASPSSPTRRATRRGDSSAVARHDPRSTS